MVAIFWIFNNKRQKWTICQIWTIYRVSIFDKTSQNFYAETDLYKYRISAKFALVRNEGVTLNSRIKNAFIIRNSRIANFYGNLRKNLIGYQIMLKPQDIVILLKILASLTQSKDQVGELTQKKLATYLCMSISEIHAGIKRLILARLIAPVSRQHKKILLPLKVTCEEFLISAVKYFIPVQLGSCTRGIATSYAAPILAKHIVAGNDPIPVWPDAEGDRRGMALEPLYRSVPRSLRQFPDPIFYELLALIDAIRSGRARERNLAMQFLKEKLEMVDGKMEGLSDKGYLVSRTR